MASRGDPKNKRKRQGDPYLDRRSGEDRRRVYSIDYFLKGNLDRRRLGERRGRSERRQDCIRIDQWSSICPDKDELVEDKPYIIKLPENLNR